ncbi:HAD superfamily hydrolase [Agrilactobacillus composti DSM 18527 = JCM 14202]|uniref:HAD superfamily hydrolase n=1 Tax=Agrilactobacillus composti DSM 18527 = JCM 14202 TaxID=1423734 RepID=A0A0R1XVS0_9LACO|nr:Cof-type HAD-IIB family hydrolase [Agrilactobacillus composti]KRM30899.1 HAD superfamily hydrolase [Agrilactobacillus composti DSM 18527 = JCM 14202]
MIKAIALDMDNTLLNSQKQISPLNQQVLKKLHQQGIQIILCSGRAFGALEPYLKTLDLLSPEDVCVCFNGGLVRKTGIHEVIAVQSLSKNEIQPLYDLAKTHHFPLDILAEDLVYSLVELGKSDYQKFLGTLMPFKDTNFAAIPEAGKYLKVVSEAPTSTLSQAAQLTADLPVTQTRSRATLLEFLPQGVNKQVGLAAALKHFHLTSAELMAFGDEDNDKEMLTYAGIGVAMGNAVPAILALADQVTATNDQDGVAKALMTAFQLTPQDL